MTRFVVLPYLRQSEARDDEDEESSLSLNAQLSAIRQHAITENWSLLPEIRDHDLKGYDPDRPGIQEMRNRIASTVVHAVAVFDLKRFARDYVWQELTYRELAARGVKVISLNDPNIDHTLNRGIMGVVNQHQTEEIARYVRIAFAERARRGVHHGKAPFGYRKDDDRLHLVDAESTWVAWIFDRFLDGWSGRAIARRLTEQRVPTPNSRRNDAALGRAWNSQMVFEIIDRITYTGIVRTGDAEGQGQHEAIISMETFLVAQKQRQAHKRVRRAYPTSWLEHLVYCGCGSRCRVARTQRDGWQFRCTADLRMGQECGTVPRNIAVHRAEQFTVAALVDDLSRLQDWETTIAQVQDRLKRQAPDADRERHRAEHRLAELARERERVLDLYAQGKLTAERWDTWEGRLSVEEQTLVETLSAQPTAPDPDSYRSTATLLTTTRGAVARAATHEPAAIRRMLQRLGVIAVIAPGSGRYATIALVWPETLAEHLHGRYW